MTVENISSNTAWNGQFYKFKAVARTLGGLETHFNVFVPPLNEDTGAQKGGFLRDAADQGIALIFPDTSPRGAGIEGEDADWDFGTGAGFYLNATSEKWKKHYNMKAFITEELPELLKQTKLPLDFDRASIFGHSMGGLGALSLYLSKPGLYRSVSAFAPICNPTECQWGKKAFSGPNGNDGYLTHGIQEGLEYDPTELIRKTQGSNKLHILIDVGTGDDFYKQGQLLPENLVQAARDVGLSKEVVDVRYHESQFSLDD